MNIIDNDLLSIQQARIILERANVAKKELIKSDKKIFFKIQNDLKRYFYDNIEKLIYLELEETHYGNIKDEIKLSKYYLSTLDKELCKYVNVYDVVKNRENNTTLIALPKGIVIVFISPYLSVLSTFQSIFLSIRTNNPIIVIPDKRCKNTILKMVRDIRDICDKYYFPNGTVSVLEYLSDEGEKVLYSSESVSLIIENTLWNKNRCIKNDFADIFKAEIGNNIVFFDKTTNLKRATKDLIDSKCFNNGLLPGSEQSLVVDSAIYEESICQFKKNGAYFLSKKEEERLQDVIYNYELKPRKELIGKSAKELAKIADIEVMDDTKILVVNKPYVSKSSPYSKEKYNPIISMYVENNWINACEKCIELILNEKKGQSLSIYSSDPNIIEQFIKKKPVNRILINTTTGFGSIGVSSQLPISLSINVNNNDNVMSSSLNVNHFIKFKEIGLVNYDRINYFKNL